MNEAVQVTTWAEALDDAREQLAAALKRVHDLKLAIRECKKRVESGEPFPGVESQFANAPSDVGVRG